MKVCSRQFKKGNVYKEVFVRTCICLNDIIDDGKTSYALHCADRARKNVLFLHEKKVVKFLYIWDL